MSVKVLTPVVGGYLQNRVVSSTSTLTRQSILGHKALAPSSDYYDNFDRMLFTFGDVLEN